MCELIVIVQTKEGNPVGLRQVASLEEYIESSGYDIEDAWTIYLQAEIWEEIRKKDDEWITQDMCLMVVRKDGLVEIATPAYLREEVQEKILGKTRKKIDR